MSSSYDLLYLFLGFCVSFIFRFENDRAFGRDLKEEETHKTKQNNKSIQAMLLNWTFDDAIPTTFTSLQHGILLN